MSDRAEYLKVKEAAELLGVSPNTLRAWGGRGKIPEFRHPINRFRLYRRSDLEDVLVGIETSCQGVRQMQTEIEAGSPSILKRSTADRSRERRSGE